jgi:hypothetical protein
MTVEEPFGQSDFREALGAALRMSDDVASLPRVQKVEGRQVFQYLGNLNRPRQVAFLSEGRRIVYDFRSRRVQVGVAQWQRPADLAASERTELLRLIHEWERMNLARQSTTVHGQ